jgi:serine/threonine protein kinase
VSSTQNLALPAGYWLQDYEIRKVLSSGGFSFVYLARDKEKKTVAIKEYLPTSIALRNNGATVLPNADDVALFRHGLKCFFDEGLALAKIDHKNIVRVLNFFRANETVYMVMQYERGKSLQDYILEHQGLVTEKFIRRVFSELSNGLREVHTQKLLHLDIKPANIYIRLDGSPVLLDFGSARQALNENLAKSSPSYTPGFASPEQYYDRKLLGPWSDIYSIGATMYSCLTRTSPMAANLRIKNDLLTPAVKIGKDNYSQGLLEIIDKCLCLDYLERPQSVFSLQKTLLAFTPALKKKTSLMNKIVDVLNKPISIK